MSTLGQMSIVIGVTTVGTQRAVREIQLLEATVKKAQVTMLSAGRAMTQFLSLPTGLIAGAAVKVFSDFEYSLAKITGLVGIAKEQTEAWGQEILGLSSKVGKGPKELVDALYFITSSGFKTSESMRILETSAKAAAAGLGETKNVADIVTSAMNAYGKGSITAASAVDVLTMAVREGKGEAPEMVQAFATSIPIAAKLGVSFDQVGGAIAAMTRMGISAATASTYLRQSLFTLLKPSKKTREGLADIGLTAQQVRDSLENNGLLDTFIMLNEKTKNLSEEGLSEIFPNIRAFMAVTSLVNENLSDTIGVFDNVKNSIGVTDKAFQTVSETMKFKWNAAMAEGETLLINFGESVGKRLIPAVEKLLQIFTNLNTWWVNLSDSAKYFILNIGGVVIALGPLMLVLKGISAFFSSISLLFSPLIGGMNKFGESMGALPMRIKNYTTATKNLVKANEELIASQKAAQAAMIPIKQPRLSFSKEQTKATSFIKAQTVASTAQVAAVKKAQNAYTNTQTAYIAAQEKVKNATLGLNAAKAKTLIADNKVLESIKKIETANVSLAASESALYTAQGKVISSRLLLGKANAAVTRQNLVLEATRRKLNFTPILVEEEIARKKLTVVKAAELKLDQSKATVDAINKKIAQERIALEKLYTVTINKSTAANSVHRRELALKMALEKADTILKKKQAEMEVAATIAMETRNKAYARALIVNETYKASTNSTFKSMRAAHIARIAEMQREAKMGKIVANIQVQNQAAIAAAAARTSKVVTVSFAAMGRGLFAFTKMATGWWVALGAIIYVIYRVIKANNELTAAQKAQKDISEKLGDAIGEEKAKLESYLVIARSEELALKTRQDAIKKINEISPEYLGNITLSTINTKAAKSALDAYNTSITNTIDLEVSRALLQEAIQKNIKDIATGANESVGLLERINLLPLANGLSVLWKNENELLQSHNKSLVAGVKGYMQMNKERAQTNFVEYTNNIKDHINNIDLATGATKDYIWAQSQVNKTISDKANLEKLSKDKSKEGAKIASQAQVEYQKQLAITSGALETQLASSKALFDQSKTRIEQEMAGDKNLARLTGVLASKATMEEKSKANLELNEIVKGYNEKLGVAKSYYNKSENLYNDYMKNIKDQIKQTGSGDGGDLTKLEQLQKDLNEALKEYTILLDIVDRNAQDYGTTTGINAEKAEKLKEILGLKNEVLARGGKIEEQSIGTVQALYNAFNQLANGEEASIKMMEDFGESNIKVFDEIEQISMGYKSTTEEMLDIEKQLGKEIFNISNLAKYSGSAFNKTEAEIETYSATLNTLHARLRQAIKDFDNIFPILEEIQNVTTKLNKAKISLIVENLSTTIADLNNKEIALADTQESLNLKTQAYGEYVRSLMDMDTTKMFPEEFDYWLHLIDEGQKKWKAYAQSMEISQSVSSGLGDALGVLAESFGELMANTITGKDLFNNVIESIADSMIQVGKLLVALGTAITITLANPIAGIMAGLGLIATGSFIRAKIKASKEAKEDAAGMAQGGIVPAGYPNDTYPAKLSSGEMVIPPMKLPEFERQTVDVNVTVEGKTKGQDLYYVIKEVERRYKNVY